MGSCPDLQLLVLVVYEARLQITVMERSRLFSVGDRGRLLQEVRDTVDNNDLVFGDDTSRCRCRSVTPHRTYTKRVRRAQWLDASELLFVGLGWLLQRQNEKLKIGAAASAEYR